MLLQQRVVGEPPGRRPVSLGRGGGQSQIVRVKRRFLGGGVRVHGGPVDVVVSAASERPSDTGAARPEETCGRTARSHFPSRAFIRCETTETQTAEDEKHVW